MVHLGPLSHPHTKPASHILHKERSLGGERPQTLAPPDFNFSRGPSGSGLDWGPESNQIKPDWDRSLLKNQGIGMDWGLESSKVLLS